MTFRVVVADRVAEAGLKQLSDAPEIEVAAVAGKPLSVAAGPAPPTLVICT